MTSLSTVDLSKICKKLGLLKLAPIAYTLCGLGAMETAGTSGTYRGMHIILVKQPIRYAAIKRPAIVLNNVCGYCFFIWGLKNNAQN
jgi:hypothetical protein